MDDDLDPIIQAFARLSSEYKGKRRSILVNAGREAVLSIRAKLGHYQPGWAELAESTKLRRDRAGVPPNDPLFIRGDLAQSYGYKVVGDGELLIESDSPIGYWQEVGLPSHNLPPRPVLVPTFYEVMVELRLNLLDDILANVANKPTKYVRRRGF